MGDNKRADRGAKSIQLVQSIDGMEQVCTVEDCSHEGKPQPIKNFPARSDVKGIRRGQCRDCIARRKRELRRKRNAAIDLKKILEDAFYRAAKEYLSNNG
jgi:hypothetical protein